MDEDKSNPQRPKPQDQKEPHMEEPHMGPDGVWSRTRGEPDSLRRTDVHEELDNFARKTKEAMRRGFNPMTGSYEFGRADNTGRKVFETFSEYMSAQLEALQVLSEAERAELERWERENVDGHSVGTSDWPGWEKYIGLPPWIKTGGEGKAR